MVHHIEWVLLSAALERHDNLFGAIAEGVVHDGLLEAGMRMFRAIVNGVYFCDMLANDIITIPFNEILVDVGIKTDIWDCQRRAQSCLHQCRVYLAGNKLVRGPVFLSSFEEIKA